MSKTETVLQQHKYIHTEKPFARSNLRFKKNEHTSPFFTQGAIVHRMQQGMCHLKGELLKIHIIFLHFLLRLLLLALFDFVCTSLAPFFPLFLFSIDTSNN